MFVLSTQDNALFRGIATIVTIALVLYAVGTAYMRTAEAANITDVYDLLSTSATSTASNHTIEFVTPTGVAAGATITITFPSGFTGTSSIVAADIDLAENAVDKTLVDGAPAAAQWGVAWSGNTLTLTAGASESITAGATTTIQIGTNASGGTNQIINPATQASYEIDITAGAFDSGHTRVAIVNSVYVTASVNTTFDFTVNGFASAGTDANGTTTTGTTTATSLPFGTLSAGVPSILAQNLTVATNAINGFVVTAEVDQQLTSSTGADIDGFRDGAYTNVPEGWGANPSNNINDENTWGHWGMTSSDSDLNAGEFAGGDKWISASTSPRTIFSHDGPADGATADKGSTTIGYIAEITALQEAGDDYSAILTYIATPTF